MILILSVYLSHSVFLSNSCGYLHGLECEYCGMKCLHPYDTSQQEGEVNYIQKIKIISFGTIFMILLINRPFPSSPQPPFQSEAKCEVFVMKISFHSY